MITKVNKVANMKGMNYDGETRYKRVKDLFLGNVHVNNLVAVATYFFFRKGVATGMSSVLYTL
jgi:hypothetical protein